MEAIFKEIINGNTALIAGALLVIFRMCFNKSNNSILKFKEVI